MSTPAPGFEIREARFDDFTLVRDHFEALHRFNAGLDPAFALAPHWEAQLYSLYCDTHDHRDHVWLLAWAGERTAGFLWGRLHRDSPIFARREWVELMAIQVDDEARGSGLAVALIDRLAEWTRAAGLDTIQAFVTASNDRALAFYAARGFEHTQSIVRLSVPRQD
jgi:ribosomal protein S18 acetylase RimI-like enzyme